MFEKNNGILDKQLGLNGHILNLDALGVFFILSCQGITKIWIMRYIRHWDIVFFSSYALSLLITIYSLWNDDRDPNSAVGNSVFDSILVSPIFWMNLLLFVVLSLSQLFSLEDSEQLY
jgi:hypothetical protein